MVKWHTITDDFPGTALGAQWSGRGTRSVSGNKLRFPITGSNYGGASDYAEDLTDSYIMARVERGLTGYAGIAIYTGNGATMQLRIQVNGSNLEMRVAATTVATIAYDATAHAWMRIREAAGTSYLETSPDGLTWTVRHSAANPADLTICDADIFGGGGAADGGEATISKFNLVPASSGAAVTGTADLTGQATLTLTSVGQPGPATAAIAGPALTLGSTGAVGRTGTAVATGPTLGLAATGQVARTGTAIQTGPQLTLGATGAVARTGTAAVPLGGLTAAAQGSRGVVSTAALAGPALGLTATGARAVGGTAQLSAPAVSLTGTSAVQTAVLIPSDKAMSLSLTMANAGLRLAMANVRMALTSMMAGVPRRALVGTAQLPAPAITLAGIGTGPLLLEAVASGMSVLYSMRRQREGYAGPCLRVRRSSDNVESDIGWIGNRLDTDALLAFVGPGDGFVSVWYDQSGTARDAIQTLPAKQPYVVQAGATTPFGTKGDICLWNPAQDRYLSYTHPADSDGYSSMMVVRTPTTASGVTWRFGPYWQASDGTNAKLYDHTGMVLASISTVARVLIATASTTEKKLRSDSGTGVVAAGLGYAMGDGTIGTYADAYAAPSDAQFHTCVVWPHPLSDLDAPYDLAMTWL